MGDLMNSMNLNSKPNIRLIGGSNHKTY